MIPFISIVICCSAYIESKRILDYSKFSKFLQVVRSLILSSIKFQKEKKYHNNLNIYEKMEKKHGWESGEVDTEFFKKKILKKVFVIIKLANLKEKKCSN